MDELNRAVVVPPAELPADVITMNSRVRLVDRRWSVYRQGDEFEWELPGDRRRFGVDAVLCKPSGRRGDTHL